MAGFPSDDRPASSGRPKVSADTRLKHPRRFFRLCPGELCGSSTDGQNGEVLSSRGLLHTVRTARLPDNGLDVCGPWVWQHLKGKIVQLAVFFGSCGMQPSLFGSLESFSSGPPQPAWAGAKVGAHQGSSRLAVDFLPFHGQSLNPSFMVDHIAEDSHRTPRTEAVGREGERNGHMGKEGRRIEKKARER